MRINHNIASLNTYRQLSINNANGSKSLEKLSSGLRINRAGDDAAGLAISEKMRAQIRGLDQASRNAQDGISLIQTAEGALNETHSILQRMRELAVQSANDTNTEADRAEIQKEMNQLTSEINRIGNTTEFNTQKLLRGAEAAGQVGSVTVVRQSSTGAVGSASIVENTESIAEQLGKWTFSIDTALQVGDKIKIGDIEIEVVAGGAIGNQINVGTGAEEQATAIKGILEGNTEFSEHYDVEDDLNGTLTITEKAGQATGTALTLDTTGIDSTSSGVASLSEVDESIKAQPGVYTFTLDTALADGEKITIGGIELVASSTGDIDPNDTLEAQLAAIRTALETEGTYTVGDIVDGSFTITETSASGLPLTVSVEGSEPILGEYSFELTANLGAGESITIGNVTLTEGIDFDAGADTSATAAAIAAALTTEGTYNATAAGSTIQITETAASGIDLTDADISVVAAGGGGFTSQLQIGANTAQSFTIEISDMRSIALGISSIDNTALKAVIVDGKTYNAAWTPEKYVTNGTDNVGAEYALDVSTHANATAAIKVIDDAINAVSAERSKLGAYQNRLEHTINNLGTSSENMTAAESRIRDVDMAKEIMEFTKNNILQQAAQAMLAQANMQPQGILQLLR